MSFANNFRCKLERAIVRALVQELDRAGFVPHHVYDGQGNVPCKDEANVMEAVFSVDESRAFFRAKTDTRKRPEVHGVFLIGGNGEDVISDWHCGDLNFDKAVRKVAYNVEDLLTVALKPFEPCPESRDGEACIRPGGHPYAPNAFHPEHHETEHHHRF